jgi:hypothetical protein
VRKATRTLKQTAACSQRGGGEDPRMAVLQREGSKGEPRGIWGSTRSWCSGRALLVDHQLCSSLTARNWANGTRLLPCSTSWCGSRPIGMPSAQQGVRWWWGGWCVRAGRPRRGGVALRFWRNPHGIRESVESVSVESAIKKCPYGKFRTCPLRFRKSGIRDLIPYNSGVRTLIPQSVTHGMGSCLRKAYAQCCQHKGRVLPPKHDAVLLIWQAADCLKCREDCRATRFCC